MKDAASRIADNSGLPSGGAKAVSRRIRSAIRRAVKAERERCVKCVWDAWHEHKGGGSNLVVGAIADKINQAKRPSRKRK
jgi:hypothetical protein